MARESAIAARIADLAEDMGYSRTRDSSKLSGSEYLGLAHEKLPGTTLKVRVSDHDLPPSYGLPGDYDVYGKGRPSGNGIHWSDAVAHLAGRVGEEPPTLAQREITRRANEEREAQEREAKELRHSPGYQEGMLAKYYPEEWKSAMAMANRERSAARKALAAKYEQANPGHLAWAPYLRPVP
jgi:hypothetical protein